jgi:hypothetical protein
MHADLYVQLVDHLLAEVMVTRDLERRDSLMRQALEWHEKALIAAKDGLVPQFTPDRSRPAGDEHAG